MWYLLDEDGEIIGVFENEDDATMELINLNNPAYCVVKEENY